LKALSDTKIFTNQQLGTVTGKVINGSTLRHMKLINKEDYKKLDTDLKESYVVSNLMEDFPPICMKDPLYVRVSFILKHFETTREIIRMEDVLEDMYGGALPVAKSRKTKKRVITEAEYLDDVSEQPSKKAKKVEVATQAEATGYGMPSIQEEVQNLESVKVLNKRTRSGKEAEPSPP